MIRRYGEPVIAGQTYSKRPGAYIILLQGNDMLVTLQDGSPPEFQLPGGGIDPGESLLPALHREVLEETGWRVEVFRRLGAFRRFTFMPEYDLWAEKLCHVFLGRPTLRHGAPIEEGHDAVWMPADTAANLLGNAGDRAFVQRLLRTSP